MCVTEGMSCLESEKLKQIIIGYIVIAMRDDYSDDDIELVLEQFEKSYDNDGKNTHDLALEACNEYF